MTEPRPLRSDVRGVVAIEYALIAAMLGLSIVGLLRFIGGDAMLGLGPIIDTLQTPPV